MTKCVSITLYALEKTSVLAIVSVTVGSLKGLPVVISITLLKELCYHNNWNFKNLVFFWQDKWYQYVSIVYGRFVNEFNKA